MNNANFIARIVVKCAAVVTVFLAFSAMVPPATRVAAAPPAIPEGAPGHKPVPGVDHPGRRFVPGKGKLRPVQSGRSEGMARPLAATPVPGLSGSQRVVPLFLLLSFADNAFSATNAAAYPAFAFSDAPGLADYYREVSSGVMAVEGDTNSVYTVNMAAGARSYAYYVNAAGGLGGYPRNVVGMVEDALSLADPVIDFSSFDNDGPDGLPASQGSIDDDGELDALVVVHAGPAGEYFGTPDYYNHVVSNYRTAAGWTLDGTHIGGWANVPEIDPPGRTAPEGKLDQTLGTLAHEFGHVLGLPDLYDTDLSSYGLGHYDLMAYGLYGVDTYDSIYDPLAPLSTPSWQRPGYPSAWSRIYMGWVYPVAVHADATVALWRGEDTPPVAYPQILKVWSSSSWTPSVPWKPSEYFLFEHRQSAPGSYDFGFNDQNEGAVLIYHVDEGVLFDGNGNLSPAPNNDENLKGIDLEEGDGLAALDASPVTAGTTTSNYGNFLNYPPGLGIGDFFSTGAKDDFWLASNPASTDNGSPAQNTGVWIINGFGTLSDADFSDYLMTVDVSIGRADTTVAGPFMVVEGAFDDGDSDAWVDAETDVALSLVVRHAGLPNTAPGVMAAIASSFFSAVTTSQVIYGNLAALAQSSGSGSFQFRMSQPSVAFTWMPVQVTISDSNGNAGAETLLLPVVYSDPTPPAWTGTGSGISVVDPKTGISLAVSWNPAADPESPPVSYELYRATEPAVDPFVETDTGWPVALTMPAYTDTNLSEGTLYRYGVRALNSDPVSADGTTNTDFASGLPTRSSGGGGGGGGCFIATAAYGSDLEPDVLLLRRFRDNLLLTSESGRALVKTYYRYSPPLADAIAGSEGVKAIVRTALKPLVWGVSSLGNTEPQPPDSAR